jgi:hypothetical protein
MGPVIVGTPVWNHNNEGDRSQEGPIPAGVVAGDLLIAQIVAKSNTAIQSNAGFYQITSMASQGDPTMRIYYKIADGTETHCNFSANQQVRSTVACFRIQGHSLTWPIGDLTRAAADTAVGQTAVPAAITTRPEELLLLFQATPNPSNYATPAGYVEAYEFAQNEGSRSGALAHKVQVVPGSTGDVVVDPSGTTRIVGILMAIRPPALESYQNVGMIPA